MLGCDWVPHQVIIITLVSSSQKLSWPPIMGYEWVQVYKLQSWLKESGKVQNLEETSEIFSRLSPTRTSSGNPFHLPSFLCCNHLPAIWLFYHFIFVPLSAGSFDLQRHRLFQACLLIKSMIPITIIYIIIIIALLLSIWSTILRPISDGKSGLHGGGIGLESKEGWLGRLQESTDLSSKSSAPAGPTQLCLVFLYFYIFLFAFVFLYSGFVLEPSSLDIG